MADSLKASVEGLQLIDDARKKRQWNKQASIWQKRAFVSLSTLKRFWKQKPIQRHSFIGICEAVEVDWQEVTQVQEQTPVENSFTMVHTADFYLERPPIESICYNTLQQPGSLLRIKAPGQTGKTLLLDQLLGQLALDGMRIVNLSFKLADKSHFQSLDNLLRWLCVMANSELQSLMTTQDASISSQNLAEYWNEVGAGSKANCTAYWEECLLFADDSPLVLALDDVDLLFRYPEISEDFFALLRFWHERGKSREQWQKLRLVVAYSTEMYIPLNIDQSPFNVGVPIDLPEFTSEQVEKLARLYQLDLTKTEVKNLMSIVGGHPSLIEQTFIHLKNYPKTNLSELLKNADTNIGIYQDYLRQHLLTLQKHQKLALAFKKVVGANQPVKLHTLLANDLNRMGLVTIDELGVQPRCQLYRLYFRSHIGDIILT